jgi:hypothetical protein
MNALLVLLSLLLLGPYPCPVRRDASGHIVRNAAAHRHFLWEHGRLLHTPRDSVVDHTIPLCGCGSDTPDNMQMQGITEAKAKDVLEKRACYKLAHALNAMAPVPEEIDSITMLRPIP